MPGKSWGLGQAPVCTRLYKRPALWNNLTNSTTITASNYDESQKISVNSYDDNLVKRHDDNSAINSKLPPAAEDATARARRPRQSERAGDLCVAGDL